MTSRMLQVILGVVIFVCSMPQGMARNFIPEEVRACFLISSGQSADEGLSASFERVSEREVLSAEYMGASAGDEALPFAFGAEGLAAFGDAALLEGDGESSDGFECKVKHHNRHSHRHHPTFGGEDADCACVFHRLSFSSLEKGYPRRPASQDALEQRTRMIRFALLASLAC